MAAEDSLILSANVAATHCSVPKQICHEQTILLSTQRSGQKRREHGWLLRGVVVVLLACPERG